MHHFQKFCRKFLPKLFLPTLCAALFLGSCASTQSSRSSLESSSSDVPQAVILMIGDGLGPSQITLARYFHFGPSTERFAFESMPVTGLVSTWSASNAVTDSGAAATAFAAGVKTINRYVGVDPDGEPLQTLAHRAKDAGWGVGYVTTTSITHATPAAFYAHVQDRYRDEGEIPQQLLDHRPDVVLAGGGQYFSAEMLDQARADGWTTWTQASDVRAALADDDVPTPLLGLLDKKHLHFALDVDGEADLDRASLAEMTRVALKALRADDEPFFLLVEGGRIDHASHAFDATGTAVAVRAFDDAVRVVLDDLARHPDTLVVLTADHATGGLAINDDVDWEALRRQSMSVARMTSKILAGELDAAEITELTGWPIEESDIESVRDVEKQHPAERRLGTILSEHHGITWIRERDVNTADTVGHTGEDVPLFAQGVGAERFHGMLDNTEIPKRIFDLMGWNPSRKKTP